LASRPHLIINVMSVRFTADTIVAASADINAMEDSASYREMNHEDNFNSMRSNRANSRALIDNRSQKHHQGRLMEGTPDASNASSMSSNFNNNHLQEQQQQHQTQHVVNGNSTSHAAVAHLLNASAQDLFTQFHEALALEPKYQPNLFLPQQSNVSKCDINFFYNQLFQCQGFIHPKLSNLIRSCVFFLFLL
jgi:hypothetical protein